MPEPTAPLSFPPETCPINGAWVPAYGKQTVEVRDPANGELVGRVPLMGAAETRDAIAAAKGAQTAWAARTAGDRADILLRWRDLILVHQEELARLLTRENGKPLTESRWEVGYSAAFIRFYAEEARRLYGEVIPSHRADMRLLVLRQPVGVVACITPWNFPAAMITRKAGPALAAGCTVVIKPAKKTPLTALALAALGERAGLPAGTLNIVTGDAAAIGGEICDSPTVRVLSFTGSTEMGRLLAGRCAGTVKKLALELGGNAPFIVFDDADLDAAADGAMQSKFRYSGQTCVCTNRFLIQSGVYDAFVERFLARVRKLKMGNGLDAGTDLGPLIDQAAVRKVQELVDDAVAKGAVVLTGGTPGPQGTFYPATVLGGVTPAMRVAREEIFGPVAPLFRFETEAQGLAMANDTEFGLACYFFSRDANRIWRVAEGLESGMVAVNSGLLSVEVAPFGGVKQSGIGREGSRHGIEEFTELKYVAWGGLR